jgi:hypothetical protein
MLTELVSGFSGKGRDAIAFSRNVRLNVRRDSALKRG